MAFDEPVWEGYIQTRAVSFSQTERGKNRRQIVWMVAHLVHRNASGKLAVVAVLFDRGGASELIDSHWKNISPEKEKKTAVANVSTDVTKLLPEDKGYYACSEGVTWLVLKAPVKIADAQIAAFANIYALNARPVQPLNGRTSQVRK